MPKIMLNGIEYAGSGGTGNTITIEITQAEYDALPSEQKNNGTLYVITDAPSIVDIIYPVGSILTSSSSANPSTWLSGTTWTAVNIANACERITGLTNVASGVDTDKNIVVTTNGNPVLLAFDADANPLSATAVWFSLYIFRDGSQIAVRTVQCSGGNSYNGDGGIVYLDKGVSAGQHTYKFRVHVGSGPINFQEGGNTEAPCCTVIELGYPIGQYAWKRIH